MIYLSKGIPHRGAKHGRISVAAADKLHPLNEAESALWSQGRGAFAHAEETALSTLMADGLIEYESEYEEDAGYSIITRCFFCASDVWGFRLPLTALERELLKWIKYAGIHLSAAELIFLLENNIRPTDALLYDANHQALIERIYTKDTIEDNVLENRMKNAACRGQVTSALLGLMKKGYVHAV